MANSKVELADGTMLMNITDSTVTSDTLAEGVVAYGVDGEKVIGALKIYEIDAALNGTSENPVQNKVLYAIIAELQNRLNNAITGISVTNNTLVWTKGDGTTSSFDLGNIKWGE